MGRSRIPSLPDDIVNCIVLRLPVTSLIRFKTVSKSWCSSINDPKFIKLHLYKSSTHISHQKLLLVTWNGCKILSTEASVSVDSKVISLPPIPGIFGSESFVHVQASSNGLVLIENPHRGIIILWNPAIRKYKLIPMPHCLLQGGYSYWRFSLFGFDYDIVADDYKVLCVQVIMDDVDKENDLRHYIFDIFSVKNQSWRRIDNVPIPPGYDLFVQSLVSLNGTINIMATPSEESNGPMVVLSLFLADEKFIVTPVPSTINERSLALCCHTNRVCVYSGINEGKFSMWSLDKDTGGGLTWNKIMNIPPLTEKPRCFVQDLICVKENGNIVWRTPSHKHNHFVEYHVRKHQLLPFKMKQVPETQFSSLVYVESLVSLPIPWD